MPAVSDVAALLLRDTDRVRFLPDAMNGGTATISFRAWDQTDGVAGSTANTTSNGGLTAYSTSTQTSTLTATSVNDAPTAVADTSTAVEAGDVNNGTAGTNPTGNVLDQ